MPTPGVLLCFADRLETLNALTTEGPLRRGISVIGDQLPLALLSQDLLRHFNILTDLLREVLRPAEGDFATQVPEQIDFQWFPVNIGIEIKDMGFCHQSRVTKSRIIANIRNSALLFAVIDNLGDINPPLRAQVFFRDAQIGGGKAE